MSWAIQAALAAAIFAAGGAAGIKWHAGLDAIAENKRIAATQEINRENAALANRTSTHFEKARTQNETRTRTITVEVDKIIERPVFRNVCIDDDGLRLLNSQIRRDTAPGESGGAVPGPAAVD
ncbi:MAG: hypothetical protein Q8M05_13035 [Rhodoferax sp.]|uniref:hypothetical protein n=1 Tax=Rhodoferax sp. TaxID=50421 RepID=UPI002731E31A|nr:hypothetical protein [Rhodoferax sp.]MDP1530299.1 hypothetical protein [Rhodoferax sp.]MDP1943354.1 hypothetical protein [Rhodoferax sp.]